MSESERKKCWYDLYQATTDKQKIRRTPAEHPIPWGGRIWLFFFTKKQVFFAFRTHSFRGGDLMENGFDFFKFWSLPLTPINISRTFKIFIWGCLLNIKLGYFANCTTQAAQHIQNYSVLKLVSLSSSLHQSALATFIDAFQDCIQISRKGHICHLFAIQLIFCSFPHSFCSRLERLKYFRNSLQSPPNWVNKDLYRIQNPINYELVVQYWKN